MNTTNNIKKRMYIEVDQLPREVSDIFDHLKIVRGTTKARLIREALIEYANRHRAAIAESVR